MAKSVVVFECVCGDTILGESIYVVGGSASLGCWDASRSVRLETSSGSFPVWRSEEVGVYHESEDSTVEFKFIRKTSAHNKVEWENVPNRVLSMPVAASHLAAHLPLHYVYACTYSEPGFKLVSLPPVGEVADALAFRRTNTSGVKYVGEWLGAEMRLCRSKSKIFAETAGTADLSPRMQALVERDREAPSWKEKLKLVAAFIADVSDGEGDKQPTEKINKQCEKIDKQSENKPQSEKTTSVEKNEILEALVLCSTYLDFIRNGTLICKDDGGHHRPNFHAALSKQLFIQLEKYVTSPADNLTADEIRVAARRIYPALPSFSDEFLSGQPLTRIRDIAHRDDIPMELKNEIKHTLQNKLHRCAGPEDLIVTEQFLHRFLQTPHQYPANFIREFQTFHKELLKFFNGTNLLDRLDVILSAEEVRADERLKDLINRFLECHQRSEGAKIGVLSMCVATSTELRLLLLRRLQEYPFLTHDSNFDPALIQHIRLTELDLEEHLFVLLSRARSLEASRGQLLELLCHGVRQVGGGGFRREECMAIYQELHVHTKTAPTERENLLALRAALERCRRLVEVFSELLLRLYASEAHVLGKALNLSTYSIEVVAEAQIRSHIIYQVSGVCESILRRVREQLCEEGVEALVAGYVVGRVVKLDSLSLSSCLDPAEGPYVLIIKNASGDEEVAGLVVESNIVAILLEHDIPLLSHLAIRARQENVVFVACQDTHVINSFPHDAFISVNATPAHVAMKLSSKNDCLNWILTSNRVSTIDNSIREEEHFGESEECWVDFSQANRVLRSGEISKETCGSKCMNSRRILELAQKSELQHNPKSPFLKLYLETLPPDQLHTAVNLGAFRAPQTAAIPFGTMETAIDMIKKKNEFDNLVDTVNTVDVTSVGFKSAVLDLENLIEEACICLVGEMNSVGEVRRVMGEDSFLAVRSSANWEDLRGVSAAGLYESYCNVEVREVGTYIGKVWKSLYCARAISARRIMRSALASMAVLLQTSLNPSHSFVVHTVNPVSKSKAEIYIEVAVGLGETLANAATRGTPYRFILNKHTGEITTLSFASFSTARMASMPRTLSFCQDHSMEESGWGGVKDITVDYTNDPFATDKAFRMRTLLRLGVIATNIESALKEPQDIEGCIVLSDIFIVQARPQPR